MTNKLYCGYASPGNYGHECGAEATNVAVTVSQYTKNGLFYAKRCEKHTHNKLWDRDLEGEILRWEVADAEKHQNQY